MDNLKNTRVFGYNLLITVENGQVRKVENSYQTAYSTDRNFNEKFESSAKQLISAFPEEFTKLQTAIALDSKEYKILEMVRREEIDRLNAIIKTLRG